MRWCTQSSYRNVSLVRCSVSSDQYLSTTTHLSQSHYFIVHTILHLLCALCVFLLCRVFVCHSWPPPTPSTRRRISIVKLNDEMPSYIPDALLTSFQCYSSARTHIFVYFCVYSTTLRAALHSFMSLGRLTAHWSIGLLCALPGTLSWCFHRILTIVHLPVILCCSTSYALRRL